MGAFRKLWLRFSWRRLVMWSLRHSVAGTQRRKQTALKHETYLTRKTQPGTNWRVFWQSITLLSSSLKTPGKATGSVSGWTHVRSLARQKSKWTMGGCGALRRCGCARTYEGTQFLCVKFCLGSAGEPTICSHCYDVLNEVTIYQLGLDNGLASIRRQAIICTDGGQVYWCIYTSLSLNELTHGPLGDLDSIFKNANFNLGLLIGIFISSYDNALTLMSWDLTDEKSTFGSGNGLVPSSHKPLPEPILIHIWPAI